MPLVKFFKSLTSLPASLIANAVYLVKTGAGFDLYATNTLGVAVPLNTPVGGADPWTYVKLAANFVTGNIAQQSTSLSFTPLLNATYIVEGRLMVQAVAITTGVKVGLNWPTGLVGNCGVVNVANSATAFISRLYGGTTNALATANTGVAVANENTYAEVSATLVTGPTPVGTFNVTVASEVSASNVTARAGSWIRYRTI